MTTRRRADGSSVFSTVPRWRSLTVFGLAMLSTASAFAPSPPFAARTTTTTTTTVGTDTALFGTNRKARRLQKKQQDREKSRVAKGEEEEDEDEEEEETVDALTGKKGKKKKRKVDNTAAAFDDRPEVSTVVVDEDTGIQRIAQGKAVMDVVTRKAVVLSPLGPEYRLAQMFPGVPPDVRAKHRLDGFYQAAVSMPEIIERFERAAVDPATGELPPHPNVTNEAIDFVLANRDLLGLHFKKTLGRLKMRAQSRKELEEARRYRALWKHFMTLEDSISAPFRQAMLDAETKIGPNFGNLDVRSYVGTELYERTAAYLVLKGMVAHWDKKVVDADFVESTPQTKTNFITLVSTGDPKRYLPEPPIIFKLDEVTRVCAMARQMTAVFVNDTALFDDLPVEVRFVESALEIRGGTALRRFAAEEFCPAEGIEPAALREGLRRLDAQLENMQIDPYGDLRNTVAKLVEAAAVGTDEDPAAGKDVYADYLYNLRPDGPGYFQTYTFDEDPNSLVRFLDNARNVETSEMGNTNDVFKLMTSEAKDIIGLGKNNKNDGTYVPTRRSLGRPHMTGWLDWLDEDRVEDTEFESDNWREIKQ